MNYQDETPLDEYTLAAFLSGTLSDEQHREVIAYLSINEEARELVCMAQDALEAAREPVTEPFALPAASLKPAAPPQPARAPARSAQSRVHLKRFAVTAVVLIALTIGWQLTFTGTDTLRGSEDASTLTIEIDDATMAMSWNALPDAYSYKVVVWDVEAAEIVARTEVRATQVEETDPFVRQLRDQLLDTRLYEVRITAYNTENRMIQRTDLLPFTYHP